MPRFGLACRRVTACRAWGVEHEPVARTVDRDFAGLAAEELARRIRNGVGLEKISFLQRHHQPVIVNRIVFGAGERFVEQSRKRDAAPAGRAFDQWAGVRTAAT